jgi:hypothetical protein
LSVPTELTEKFPAISRTGLLLISCPVVYFQIFHDLYRSLRNFQDFFRNFYVLSAIYFLLCCIFYSPHNFSRALRNFQKYISNFYDRFAINFVPYCIFPDFPWSFPIAREFPEFFSEFQCVLCYLLRAAFYIPIISIFFPSLGNFQIFNGILYGSSLFIFLSQIFFPTICQAFGSSP